MNTPLQRFLELGPEADWRRQVVWSVLGPLMFALVLILTVVEGVSLQSWYLVAAAALLGVLYATEVIWRRGVTRDLHAARWGMPMVGESPVLPLARELDAVRSELLDRSQRILGERALCMGILNTLPVGVLVASESGRVEFFNQAASAIFPGLATASSKISIQGQVRIAEITRVFQDICVRGSVAFRDVIVYGEGDRTVRVGGVQLRDRGLERLVILVVEDVTDRRRAERVRREFIGNVSHELRTPITALMATSEMLMDGVDDEEQQKSFLGVIHRHAERLNTLVKDLLVLSRLDHPSASRALRRDPADISELCASAVQTVREGSQKEGHDVGISIEIGTDVPAVAFLHRSLMQHALVNLVENAVKHVGADGMIRVRVHRDGETLVFRVIDNGSGIASEHLSRIFERFYRVDKGRSRQEGGSGIGLAIVKHVALVHGGSVSADSTVGKGSTFVVTIPLVTAANEAEGDAERERRSGVTAATA